MTPIDIDRARAQTPGCERVLHLNNAGTSLAPTPVLDVVTGYLRDEANIGGYELAERRTSDIDAVYESAARFIGARPEEIAFTDSASRAWNAAFTAVPFRDGDRVLVSSVEYPSATLALLQLTEQLDVSVEVIPDDAHGQVDVDALEAMLDDRVRLVAVTHVPTNSGLVNPVVAIGTVVGGHDALYLVDACQSAGQLPLDVETIGCDLLSLTGRKFLRAPRGTGLLYVRSERLEELQPSVVDQRGAEWVELEQYRFADGARRFESFERSVATMLGFGAALEYAMDFGIGAISERACSLGATLRERLDGLDRVRTHDPGTQRCAIVTFTVDGVAPWDAVRILRERGINLWACELTSARRDLGRRGLTDGVLRASPHVYNTEHELDVLVEAVAGLVD